MSKPTPPRPPMQTPFRVLQKPLPRAEAPTAVEPRASHPSQHDIELAQRIDENKHEQAVTNEAVARHIAALEQTIHGLVRTTEEVVRTNEELVRTNDRQDAWLAALAKGSAIIANELGASSKLPSALAQSIPPPPMGTPKSTPVLPRIAQSAHDTRNATMFVMVLSLVELATALMKLLLNHN